MHCPGSQNTWSAVVERSWGHTRSTSDHSTDQSRIRGRQLHSLHFDSLSAPSSVLSRSTLLRHQCINPSPNAGFLIKSSFPCTSVPSPDRTPFAGGATLARKRQLSVHCLMVFVRFNESCPWESETLSCVRMSWPVSPCAQCTSTRIFSPCRHTYLPSPSTAPLFSRKDSFMLALVTCCLSQDESSLQKIALFPKLSALSDKTLATRQVSSKVGARHIALYAQLYLAEFLWTQVERESGSSRVWWYVHFCMVH